MAIQSFSVGQVLTAAQVNALQANDYNQTVSNKTASYTLVAADKGTRIAISSTSATTITVNTSLFSAGDTLFIQNLNTGVSTITAGTATVTTSSSLALAQWEGGTLYFTSASAAIFFKSDGAAAGGGGAYTSIASGSLSGTSVVISDINQTYKHLYLVVHNPVASSGRPGLRINGDSGTNYTFWRVELDTATATASAGQNTINPGGDITSAVNWTYTFFIELYSEANYYKPITVNQAKNGGNSIRGWANYSSTTAYTSLTIVNTDAVSYTSGTYTLYGVK